jgi:hypothetical protein
VIDTIRTGQHRRTELVCGHGSAIAGVPGEDAPRGTPPWIA